MSQAFDIDKLSTYMLICNARNYRFVLHTPGEGLWWSSIKMLPLTAAVTAEQLASPLEDLIKTLAYVLTKQMDWVDMGLPPQQQLPMSILEFSGGHARLYCSHVRTNSPSEVENSPSKG